MVGRCAGRVGMGDQEDKAAAAAVQKRGLFGRLWGVCFLQHSLSGL